MDVPVYILEKFPSIELIPWILFWGLPGFFELQKLVKPLVPNPPSTLLLNSSAEIMPVRQIQATDWINSVVHCASRLKSGLRGVSATIVHSRDCRPSSSTLPAARESIHIASSIQLRS